MRVTDFHYLLVSLIGCLFISVCLYSRNIVFTKNYLYNDYLNQEATFRFQFIFLCWTNISISIEVYEDHKQKTALKYLITIPYTENFGFFSNKSLYLYFFKVLRVKNETLCCRYFNIFTLCFYLIWFWAKKFFYNLECKLWETLYRMEKTRHYNKRKFINKRVYNWLVWNQFYFS